MLKIKNESAWIILSLIFGFGLCYVIYPQLILHPGNVSILKGDSLLFFTGWDFYRQSPWEWPLTHIRNLMYPLGTSLIFTDSIPLLSIFLKLFSKFIPEPFAFNGMVALINSSLMFYTGSLFFRILRSNIYLSIIGGLFTLFSSIFLWRLAEHFSLTAQWLIILELTLIIKPRLNPKTDIRYQLLLIFLAVSLNPYFAAMLVALSIALCWKLYIRQSYTPSTAFFILIAFGTWALISAWFFGWFSISSSVTQSGYGLYSSNLLALINPISGSFLLPELPQGRYQYEGAAYLGVGIILPLVAIIFLFLCHKIRLFSAFTKERLGLFIILILFFLFGLSNIIQIGPYSITMFNVPDGSKIASLFGIYRCTGRFIWPVFYTIQFFTLIKLYDLLQFQKFPRIIILTLLLILQIWDNSYQIKLVKNLWIYFANSGPVLRGFTNPIWLNLSKFNIKHMFILDNITTDALQLQLAMIALNNHLTINNAHLARITDANKKYNDDQFDRFSQGQLLSDTLYIGLANHGLYPAKYCSTVDGYMICALNPKLIALGSKLVNSPDTMIFLGKNLPSVVGNIQGDTITANVGKNSPGTLSYGPYITIPRGNYNVTFVYSSSSESTVPVGIFDVYQNQKQYTQYKIYGTNSITESAILAFTIPVATSNFEFRTFFTSGNLNLYKIELHKND